MYNGGGAFEFLLGAQLQKSGKSGNEKNNVMGKVPRH